MTAQQLKQFMTKPDGWAWDWTPPDTINGVPVSELLKRIGK